MPRKYPQNPLGPNMVIWPTMFKLPHRVPKEGLDGVEVIPKATYVECVNCQVIYPLKDLLEGELNEEHCPACDIWAKDYFEQPGD